MITKFRVRKHEVGLWFRHGDFKQVLAPGAYWMPGRLLGFGRDRVETYNTLKAKVRAMLTSAEYLAQIVIAHGDGEDSHGERME